MISTRECSGTNRRGLGIRLYRRGGGEVARASPENTGTSPGVLPQKTLAPPPGVLPQKTLAPPPRRASPENTGTSPAEVWAYVSIGEEAGVVPEVSRKVDERRGWFQRFLGRSTNESRDGDQSSRRRSGEWRSCRETGRLQAGQGQDLSDGTGDFPSMVVAGQSFPISTLASYPVSVVVGGLGQAASLNGSCGGKAQRGNMSLISRARSRRRSAPARKASTKAQ